MKYADIKTFKERCEAHPDHQQGMISHPMIQMRLHEEVEELRNYIEWHLEEQNFCKRCGKRTQDIHTCTPPEWAHYNNTAA